MSWAFAKMHGAGNDFVLLDDPQKSFPLSDPETIRSLCAPHTGLGTEGLIILRPPEEAAPESCAFRMHFFNPDGSRAEMCGNGARCLAFFAYLRGMAGKKQLFETDAGFLNAEILEISPQHARVRVAMSDPHSRSAEPFYPEGSSFLTSFINTGVPHAVTFVEDIAAAPVVSAGRALRSSPSFAPAGTNVDFVQVLDVHSISLRTYERGVEDETAACGTGAVAAALTAMERGFCVSPVAVQVAFGDTLTVSAEIDPQTRFAVKPLLEGPAVLICSGEINAPC